MEFVDYAYRRRVFVGLCVAVHVPFVLAVVFMSPALVGRIVDAEAPTLVGAWGDALGLFGQMYFVYTAISGVSAIAIGLPIVLTLRRLSLELWWCFVAGGVFVGVAAGVGLGYLASTEAGSLPERVFSRGTGLAALVGALSALTFWYLVYRRAPSRGPS
ncbi:MAG: hypothetical protein OEU09_01140 [Rhodospirillales bacterium]|nr:hypothetical protein [Rhodospirillales bacterium]MDH3790272.1 hypothetical protein [Rhodospirillales bacterium]MDH3909868.1 hypothetical protein [Rhodospirillales bacterium]MDH3919606.1 hypothetical protein [Rhodospirillales bacterium]MDH3967964.1 hypothetical protein [Rhodospirillales bacterium]